MKNTPESIHYPVFSRLRDQVRSPSTSAQTRDIAMRLLAYQDKLLPEGVSPLLFTFLVEVTLHDLWPALPDERMHLLLRDYLIGNQQGPIRDQTALTARVGGLSPRRVQQLVTAGTDVLYRALQKAAPELAYAFPRERLRKDKPPREQIRPLRRHRSRHEAARESWTNLDIRRRRVDAMKKAKNAPASPQASEHRTAAQAKRFQDPEQHRRQVEILEKARRARRARPVSPQD